MTITVEVSAETFELLSLLTKSPAMGEGATVAKVVAYLAHCAADGVRRPGAWERGWVEQAFGAVGE